MTVPQLILGSADRHGGRRAVIETETGDELSYSELAAGVRRAAARLAVWGIARGDVVAVMAPNGAGLAVAIHGVLACGAVLTPVNPLCAPAELDAQLRDSGAVALLASPAARDRLAHMAGNPGVPVLALEELMRGPTVAQRTTSASPTAAAEDLAVIPYSSGTTGLPKGVMLTHANLTANLAQAATIGRFGPGEVVLAALPFFHLTGLQLLLNLSLAGGATVVTMARFELDRFLELVAYHGVTRAFVVPPIVLALAKQAVVAGRDVGSLQALFCGAAPLGAEIQLECARRLDCAVLQGYGLTECAPLVSHVRESEGTDGDGSVGAPVPGTEVAIAGERGEAGEILVRGPQVMRGFLARPRESADALNDHGWLHTGDIGRLDHRGRLHVVDRLKEMIKCNGFQVAPAELEAVLVSHPEVDDAAVIPSPDPRAGEVPKALVRGTERLDPDEVLRYVAERVSGHKRIRRLEVVDAIPRSPSGKILRRVLVQRERTRGAVAQ